MSRDPQNPVSNRVVVDTHVWISAFLAPQGTPARLVQRVLSRGQAVFTIPTFAELDNRLWKPKFDRYLSIELRHQLLHDLNGATCWVDVSPDQAARTFCRDTTDDPFIHAALAAAAPWLVTGDEDLLILDPPPGLTILTPSAALDTPAFMPVSP
jgi:putative PIN family toxin of toxin-antitoxin system